MKKNLHKQTLATSCKYSLRTTFLPGQCSVLFHIVVCSRDSIFSSHSVNGNSLCIVSKIFADDFAMLMSLPCCYKGMFNLFLYLKVDKLFSTVFQSASKRMT